jgi:hypothetical protein
MKRSSPAAAVLVVFVVGCGGSSTSKAKETNAEQSAVTPKQSVPTALTVPSKPTNIQDSFSVGAIFSGERSIMKAAHQSIKLEVTKRVGDDFEGELVINDKAKNGGVKAKVTANATIGNGEVALVRPLETNRIRRQA